MTSFHIALFCSHIFRAALVWHISPSWKGLQNIINGRRRFREEVTITKFFWTYFTSNIFFQSDWTIVAAIIGFLIMVPYELMIFDYPYQVLWLYSFGLSFLYNSIWTSERGSTQGLWVATIASFVGSLHVFIYDVEGPWAVAKRLAKQYNI